jgi:DNA-binding NtrC family response regulator
MPAFLLLDADRNFRSALEIALRVEGAEVAAAGSVAEAERLLETRSFDLVAIDSLLGGAEALLARFVSERRPVVAIGPHPELLARAARRFGVPTLEKPFDATALVELAGDRRSPAVA